MNLKCPECRNECYFEMHQKMLNDNCDVRLKFNILEVECECGNKGLVSVSPKEITIINKKLKIVNF